MVSSEEHHVHQPQTNRTMKKLSETLTEQGIAFGSPIEIKDHIGRVTYYEDSKGLWCRWEYDSLGNETCYEDSYGFCCKREYDSDGNETYYENNEGAKRGTPRSAKTCEGKVIEVDGIKYKLTAQ